MSKISWAKATIRHKDNCEKILGFSKEIRYAGVFNQYGRTISGKIRSGIKPIFSPNAIREEFFAIASVLRLRDKTTKSLGELKYVLINQKKINILLFYKNGVTYYITINSKTLPNQNLINKIERLIIQG
tara:strand:- start:759 stop:1145 length:387 start_codon:yes stop_codon:yes gene_type:complete